MKIAKYIFVIGLIALGLGGCKYDFVVPPTVPITDPDDPNAMQISFANDIQPIFDSKCVTCHFTGKTPDLTEGNSYASLTSGGMINTADPEASKLYTQPTEVAGHQQYNDTEALLVLGWIKQGAKNN